MAVSHGLTTETLATQRGVAFQELADFPEHLAAEIVPGEFAHAILNRLLLAHLVDPVPV